MAAVFASAPVLPVRASGVQARRAARVAAPLKAARVSRTVLSRRSLRVSAAKSSGSSSTSSDDATEFEVPEVVTQTLDKVSAAWEKTDDKPAVVSLGVFGFVGLVALAGVLKAVESIPIIPDLLELIGIAYSLWFTYRYLLFKPDRIVSLRRLRQDGLRDGIGSEELKSTLNKYKDQILG